MAFSQTCAFTLLQKEHADLIGYMISICSNATLYHLPFAPKPWTHYDGRIRKKKDTPKIQVHWKKKTRVSRHDFTIHTFSVYYMWNARDNAECVTCSSTGFSFTQTRSGASAAGFDRAGLVGRRFPFPITPIIFPIRRPSAFVSVSVFLPLLFFGFLLYIPVSLPSARFAPGQLGNLRDIVKEVFVGAT